MNFKEKKMKFSKRLMSLVLCAVMIFGVFGSGLVAYADVTLSGGDTQTHTVANYQSAYDTYKSEYGDLGKYITAYSNIVVPGLSQADNMIPQGLTYWEAKDWILISAYSADKSQASVIYAVRSEDGNFVAQFNLKDSSENNITDHVSGIAFSGNNLYIASANSTISYIPASALDVAVGTVKNVTYSATIDFASELNGANTSYASFGDGTLWTGNFYIEGNSSYDTKANAESGSMLLGYKLQGSDSASEWNSLVALAGNPSYVIPLDSYGVNKVQCATVSGGYCYVGTSYGRKNDSNMYVFRVDLTKSNGTINVGGNSKPKIPMNNVATFKHLPMTEGLHVFGNVLFNIFESGAWEYNGSTPSSVSKNPTDCLWSFDISALLEGGSLYKAADVTIDDLTFVVPEVIYLAPQANAQTAATSSTFQYYVNNNNDYSVKTTYQETTGYIHTNRAGTLTAKFYNEELGSLLSGGSVTVANSNGATGNGVNLSSGTSNITAGASPSIAASAKGYYIEWCLSYHDDVDGKDKAAYAYTYVYKPYVDPVFAAGRAGNTTGTKHYTMGYTWITGIHGISVKGNYNTRNTASGSEKISNSLLGIQTGNGTTGPIDGWVYKVSTDGTGNGWYTSYDGSDWLGRDYRVETWERSTEGFLYVDTSRYSNLKDIPNFSTGLHITDTNGSDDVYAYLSDFTGNNFPTEGNGEGSRDNRANGKYYSTTGGAYLKGNKDTRISGGGTDTLWDKVPCDRSISGTSTFRYVTKAGMRGYQGGDYAMCNLWNIVDITGFDKSSLRTAVANATKAMAKLGVKSAANGVLLSCYFDTDTDYKWAAFASAYKSAVIALTKLESTDNFNTLASNLNSALAALCTKISFDGNGGTLSKTDNKFVTIGTAQKVNYTPSNDGYSATAPEGYEFSGWSTDASASSGSATVSVGYNNIVYAIYTKKSYTITYNADGGSAVADKTVKYDDPLPSAESSKSDYILAGWTYVKEGTSEAYNGTTMPAYNLTATAQWQKIGIDDTFVVECSLETALDVLENDADGAQKAITAVSFDGITYKSSIDEEGYDYALSISAGKINFKPKKEMGSRVIFSYKATYGDTEYTAQVTVIPATSVYYEEDSEFVTFNGGWTDASTKVEKVADTVSDVYGGLSAYDNTDSTKYSLGNAKMVTVDSDNKGDKNLNAQFTFTGTGFEVYSMTDSTSGLVLIDIVNVNDSNDKYPTTMVNTYLGYSYGQLYYDSANDSVTLNDTGVPVYFTDDEGPGTFFIGYYTVDENGNPVQGSKRGTTVRGADEDRASGWVRTDSEGNGLYQVPVISRTDLKYGTYTVTISPRYSKMQSSGRSEYSFYFDSVRIYNPVNPDNSDDSANDVYKAAKEYKPQYQTIRSILLSADELTDAESEGYQTGIALIDVKGGATKTTSLVDYKQFGPKNETYLEPNQAIAFYITTGDGIKPDKISLGTRVIKENPATGTLTINGTQLTVNGSTEIYRDISSAVNLNDPNFWRIEGGKYKSGLIVIANNSSATISLTKLKWSYSGTNAGKSAQARQLTFSFDKPSLLASANIINAAFSPVVYADSSAVTVEWENDSVKLGETAKLIITATTDYEKAFVDGAEIAGYTEDGDIRTWTYTFTAEELGDFMNDVTLIDVNGYETKAIATGKIKVSAPVPDIDSAHTEWENDKVTAGDTAVLKIVTPSDIVKVKVGKTEITEFTSNEDGTREFRLEMPAATAGEYKYFVIITEKYGYSSVNGETPLLTVEVPATPENPETPEDPETPENGENTENTENGDKEETLSFFQRLMKAIIGLFTKIANIFKGAFN